MCSIASVYSKQRREMSEANKYDGNSFGAIFVANGKMLFCLNPFHFHKMLREKATSSIVLKANSFVSWSECIVMLQHCMLIILLNNCGEFSRSSVWFYAWSNRPHFVFPVFEQCVKSIRLHGNAFAYIRSHRTKSMKCQNNVLH